MIFERMLYAAGNLILDSCAGGQLGNLPLRSSYPATELNTEEKIKGRRRGRERTLDPGKDSRTVEN
jgi:hypothetical protein